jgi:hypothetical protein
MRKQKAALCAALYPVAGKLSLLHSPVLRLVLCNLFVRNLGFLIGLAVVAFRQFGQPMEKVVQILAGSDLLMIR